MQYEKENGWKERLQERKKEGRMVGKKEEIENRKRIARRRKERDK